MEIENKQVNGVALLISREYLECDAEDIEIYNWNHRYDEEESELTKNIDWDDTGHC